MAADHFTPNARGTLSIVNSVALPDVPLDFALQFLARPENIMMHGPGIEFKLSSQNDDGTVKHYDIVERIPLGLCGLRLPVQFNALFKNALPAALETTINIPMGLVMKSVWTAKVADDGRGCVITEEYENVKGPYLGFLLRQFTLATAAKEHAAGISKLGDEVRRQYQAKSTKTEQL